MIEHETLYVKPSDIMVARSHDADAKSLSVIMLNNDPANPLAGIEMVTSRLHGEQQVSWLNLIPRDVSEKGAYALRDTLSGLLETLAENHLPEKEFPMLDTVKPYYDKTDARYDFIHSAKKVTGGETDIHVISFDQNMAHDEGSITASQKFSIALKELEDKGYITGATRARMDRVKTLVDSQNILDMGLQQAKLLCAQVIDPPSQDMGKAFSA